jgi:hypothetical protein
MPVSDERHSSHVLDNPGAWQMTVWTLALAKNFQFRELLAADPHLFALFYASCATAINPPTELHSEPMTLATVSDQLLPTIKDLQRQFGEFTTGAFARMYLEGMAVFPGIAKEPNTYENAIKVWHENATAELGRVVSNQEQNLDWVADLLDLNQVEQNILAFQLNRHRPGFAQLYDLLMRADGMTAIVLSAIFDVGFPKIIDALCEDGVLVSSGLLGVMEHPLRVEAPSVHLRAVLTEVAESEEEFLERFVKPLKSTPTTSSLARLDERDRDILLRALRLPSQKDVNGVHVLVYGPSAVDKRDMLARLFEQENLDAYIVVAKGVPQSELPTWVFIAQRYLEQEDPEAVLVIERADQALASRSISIMSIFGIVDDEPDHTDEGRASDTSLTSSPVRCVWLSDRARSLSERNIGSFLFHCEALPGSRADRRTRITQIITDLGLSPEFERELSMYSLLGDRQVRTAAELAQRLVEHGEPNKNMGVKERASFKNEVVVGREKVIRRAVAQSQKVLGRDHTEQLRDSVTKYSLDNLNIDGRFTPQQILDALRVRPKGSLCFHGIPGAGKTQLAEYMAVELDLSLIVRSASDLLSKWLGESEQNIAAMFAEAEAEGALLFLDEADSFLRDRALARAEWSVTQVNELLQKMERFDGIFIAATNLMDVMDAAAMRRFTWKLEFKSLRPEQAWTMFCTEAGLNSAAPKNASLRAQLLIIPDLAPGDFATVKRQANMLGVPLTPDEWIEQLAVEAKAKMNGLRRHKLGFAGEQ